MLRENILKLENQQLTRETQAKQKNRGVNEIWADAVALAAGNASNGTAPKPLCAHLVRMGDLGNVPRQEKKFKASLRQYGESEVVLLFVRECALFAICTLSGCFGVGVHLSAVRTPTSLFVQCPCFFLNTHYPCIAHFERAPCKLENFSPVYHDHGFCRPASPLSPSGCCWTAPHITNRTS